MENNPDTNTIQPSPTQPPSTPPTPQPNQLPQQPQQPVIIQIQRPESPVEKRIKKAVRIFGIFGVSLFVIVIAVFWYNIDAAPQQTMTVFNQRAKTTFSSTEGISAASTFECKLNSQETWSYEVTSSVVISAATNEEFIKIAHTALTKMLAVMRSVHDESSSGCTEGYLYFASQDDRISISVRYHFPITYLDDTALHDELDTEYQKELKSLQKQLDE